MDRSNPILNNYLVLFVIKVSEQPMWAINNDESLRERVYHENQHITTWANDHLFFFFGEGTTGEQDSEAEECGNSVDTGVALELPKLLSFKGLPSLVTVN